MYMLGSAISVTAGQGKPAPGSLTARSGREAESTSYIDFKGRGPLWETRAMDSMAGGGALRSQGMDVHAGALLGFSFGIS